MPHISMASIYLRRSDQMENPDDTKMEKGIGTITVASFMQFFQMSSFKPIDSVPNLILN